MAGSETAAIFEGKILSWALLLQQEKDQSLLNQTVQSSQLPIRAEF